MRKREREVSDINEIESIISEADVCRIAIADGNIPYIVTLNFGYIGGTEKKLYFHCANEGRKLDMIRKNNFVCFEMDIDHILTEGKMACEFSMNYKSVVGYGHISIVKGLEEKISGFNSIMSHYVSGTGFDYDKKMIEKTTILRLDIDKISGKKC
jgi:uncharacterized protein